MGKILVKKFYLSRSGESNRGQDAMECNFVNGRFAVADGVTNSFHPEFVAQALCNTFVRDNVPMQEWKHQLSSHILDEISDFWANEVESLAANLNGRQRRLFEMNREDFPMGSSTFAGIECNLSSSSLSYNILGDSSLFIIPQEGDFSIVCSSHCEERYGRQYILYDDTPACISNFVYNCQGRPRLYFNEQWEEGYCPLVPGFVVLLTDGAAQWLQDTLIKNKKSIELMWNISTQDQLIDFVSEQRAQHKMDDDLAIYILKIDSEINDGFEEVLLRSETLIGVETKVIREEDVPLSIGKTPYEISTTAEDISENDMFPSTEAETSEEDTSVTEDGLKGEVAPSTEVETPEDTSSSAEDILESEVSPSTEVETLEEDTSVTEDGLKGEVAPSTEVETPEDTSSSAEDILESEVSLSTEVETLEKDSFVTEDNLKGEVAPFTEEEKTQEEHSSSTENTAEMEAYPSSEKESLKEACPVAEKISEEVLIGELPEEGTERFTAIINTPSPQLLSTEQSRGIEDKNINSSEETVDTQVDSLKTPIKKTNSVFETMIKFVKNIYKR